MNGRGSLTQIYFYCSHKGSQYRLLNYAFGHDHYFTMCGNKDFIPTQIRGTPCKYTSQLFKIKAVQTTLTSPFKSKLKP